MEKEEKYDIDELSAQLRLAEIMNDTPREIQLGERTFKIKALRAGTQWLVAQEACKIAKTNESYTDIIRRFAENIPAVVRVLCLVILNDKDKINGKEYDDLHDYILWEVPRIEWIGVLNECLQMLDLRFFFTHIEMVENFRKMTMTKREQP